MDLKKTIIKVIVNDYLRKHSPSEVLHDQERAKDPRNEVPAVEDQVMELLKEQLHQEN